MSKDSQSLQISFKHTLVMKYYTAISLQPVVLYIWLKTLHLKKSTQYVAEKKSLAILVYSFKINNHFWFHSQALKAQFSTQ